MKLPRDIGPVHFVGIGGIGMSGIAEVLVNLGYTVQGSDASESANVKRLRDKGVKIAIGHAAENRGRRRGCGGLDSAIKSDNPELIGARAQRLPVVRRAEMLAELMRLKSCVAIAGTHGKTTTTSMVAALLDAGGFDPTVINGGIINAYGTNARLGAGEWMVVEADESDGTFPQAAGRYCHRHQCRPRASRPLQDLRGRAGRVPRFRRECAVLRIRGDVHRPSGGAKLRRQASRIAASSPTARIRKPMRGSSTSHAGGTSLFTIVLRERDGQSLHEIKNIALPMPGRHNALNATAAVAVAHELGCRRRRDPQGVLAKFGGVRRRFTRTGTWNGVTIIDDYGHHPVEIAAVLKAARESTKRPGHRRGATASLTRLAIALFEQFCTCFNDADVVDRRACLSGRRGTDRGCRPRRPGARPCVRMVIGKWSRSTVPNS
jgi:UDP-N-acetylmuramate--alanine ligase